MVVEYLIWATFFTLLLNMLLLIIFTWGWYSLKHFHGRAEDAQLMTSIVVAVRNEAQHINQLLYAIAKQDYPFTAFELILVDDHSEDNTVELIKDFMASKPEVHIDLIHAKGHGKKSAIAEGIQSAKGELIVTTDGDCLMETDWLTTLVAYYQKFKPELIIAPVVYTNEKGFWQQIFSLDFASLVASGAGSVGIGLPLMGNAANMAFSKKAWKKVNAANQKESFVSGDDVFLIHRIAKEYGRKAIHFVKSTSAIVRTDPPVNLAAFFQQRIRWASKAKGYRSPWAIVVSVVVLMTNLLMASTFIAGFFRDWFFVLYLMFVILKLLIDLPLLAEFTRFVSKRKLLFYLLPLSIIYPIYIIVAAFPALFFRFEWKGRKNLK